MDQKTAITIGVGVVAVIVIYLMTRNNSGVIQQGDDYVPQNYMTYNVPRMTGTTPDVTVEYTQPDQQATTQPVSKCMCDSGCGSNGEYAGALRSVLQNFYDSTAALTNAYQNAILATLPDSLKQFINNDAGYIESRRALAAIGTESGMGNNLPMDLTNGQYRMGFRGVDGSQ